MVQKYLERGWSLIPLSPRGKLPPPGFSWKEYQVRKADLNEIQGWKVKYPKSNLGGITGQVSGIVVVDIDGPIGEENAKRLNLPPTLTAKSANGRHLYYKHPGMKVKTLKGILGPDSKVDVRGDGGLIVLPPSIHESGVRYQWVDESQEIAELPQTVIDAVNRFEEWQEKKDPRHPGWVEEVLEHGAGEDGVPMKRHDALIALSSHFLNFMDKPQEIVTILKMWNTRNRPPYPEEKVEAQFYDIYSRWQRGEYGQKEKSVDVSNTGKIVEDFLSHLERKEETGKPEISSGCDELEWYTWGLQRKQIYVLGAPTGTGKTSFLVPITHAVLSQGKRVLYFPTELAKEEPMEKLVSLGANVPFEAIKTKSINGEERRRVLTFLQWLKDEGKLRMCDHSRPTKDLFRAAIDEHEPDVVILDHLSHTGGETDNRYHNLQELVLSLKDIVKKYDCNLFAASQLKRPIRDLNTNSFYPPTLYDFYGCADIENEASIAILMQKGGDNTGKLIVAKNRILPRDGTFELDFDPVTTCYKLSA